VFQGTRTYLQESWSELRKVAWPTRRTVVNLTLIVIAVSVAVGFYIGVIDYLLSLAIERMLQ